MLPLLITTTDLKKNKLLNSYHQDLGRAGLVGFGPDTDERLDAGFEQGKGIRKPSASMEGRGPRRW